MNILLTGATGFVGRPLARRLTAEGHKLCILTRNPKNSFSADSGGIVVIPWLEGGLIPDAALEGVDAVIHLAGENIGAWPWTSNRKRRIRDSRVLGTRALVEAMGRQTQRPSIFLSASAAGYYGDTGSKPVREEDPPGPGFLAEVVQAWEAEIFKAEALGIRTVAIRNGLILGRGSKGAEHQGAKPNGALGKMLPTFQLGLGAVMGTGLQYWSWIHLEDTVGIFLHALSHPDMRGAVNGCAPEPVTQAEFSRSLAKVCKRPLLFWAPAFLLRLALGGMADTLLQGQRLNAEKIMAWGYRFQYPSLLPALEDVLAPI